MYLILILLHLILYFNKVILRIDTWVLIQWVYSPRQTENVKLVEIRSVIGLKLTRLHAFFVSTDVDHHFTDVYRTDVTIPFCSETK